MTARQTLRQKSASYLNLAQWASIALLSAVAANVVFQGFFFLYRRMTGFLSSLEGIPLWIWPTLAVFPVGLAVYRLVPSSMGEGIPSYLEGIRRKKGALSFRETVFKFLAALLTLGCFGNGGFVGPLGRMSAGFMSGFGRILTRLGMRRELLPLFPVCGMASLLGTLMHSSIGAGIFAVEIILKTNMQYRHLFPAILASSASVSIARSLGLSPLISFDAPFSHTDMDIFLCALFVMVSAGFLGKGFILSYGGISRIFLRDSLLPPGRRTLLMMAGTMTASLTLLVNPALIGTSDGIVKALFAMDRTVLYGHLPGEIPLFVVLLLLLVCKGLANIFTVASGMSAGFTGPAILMGLLLGAAFAEYFGIPEGSDEFYTLMAAGFASYFASMMNTPIASAVITVELFGLHYSLPAGLAAVVGYMVNQDHTLYDLVLEERNERLDELDQTGPEEDDGRASPEEGDGELDVFDELIGVSEKKRSEDEG
jgi:H+/Cl- antiporter ClcA